MAKRSAAMPQTGAKHVGWVLLNPPSASKRRVSSSSVTLTNIETTLDLHPPTACSSVAFLSLDRRVPENPRSSPALLYRTFARRCDQGESPVNARTTAIQVSSEAASLMRSPSHSSLVSCFQFLVSWKCHTVASVEHEIYQTNPLSAEISGNELSPQPTRTKFVFCKVAPQVRPEARISNATAGCRNRGGRWGEGCSTNRRSVSSWCNRACAADRPWCREPRSGGIRV